jgi:hypothetical protein
VLGTLARVQAGVKQVSSSGRRFRWIPMSTACGQRCGNDVHLWGEPLWSVLDAPACSGGQMWKLRFTLDSRALLVVRHSSRIQ